MALVKSVAAGQDNQYIGSGASRGLANADHHHAVNEARRAERTASGAVLSLDQGQAEVVTYLRPRPPADVPLATAVTGSASLVIGDDTNVHIQTRSAVTGSASLVIGDDANVHIQTRSAVTGSASLVIGDDANVHIQTRSAVASGSASLVIGDDANVHLQTRSAVTSGSASLIIGDDANVHLQTRSVAAAETSIASRAPARTSAMEISAPGARSLDEAARRQQALGRPHHGYRAQQDHAHAHAEQHRTANRTAYPDPRVRIRQLLIEKTLSPTRDQLDSKQAGAVAETAPNTDRDLLGSSVAEAELDRSVDMRLDTFG